MTWDSNIVWEVRRVSWNFYTWHLQTPEKLVVGYGNKAAAADAVRRFTRKIGGREL